MQAWIGCAGFLQMVVLLDMVMPGLPWPEVLKQVDPAIPVIMFTGHECIPSAVEAMRLGAYDYLTKSGPPQELLSALARARQRRTLALGELDLREVPALQVLTGPSQAMCSVRQRAAMVGVTELSVLLTGESGTGKSLLAQAMHKASRRAEGPFIVVDCGAIPETLIESELFGHERGAFTGATGQKRGQFELATGGTLFLDEISLLPYQAQGKLLMAIQNRKIRHVGGLELIPVDVRILAATNTLLQPPGLGGHFRHDLYYRLAEYVIELPPLRQHKEDLLPLTMHFIQEANAELGKSVRALRDATVEALQGYSWPGNVRELRNAIRRAVLANDSVLDARALGLDSDEPTGAQEDPTPLNTVWAPPTSLHEVTAKAVAHVEAGAIRHALRETDGNKSRAAKLLQVDYKTLLTKIRRYGIDMTASAP